MSINKEDIVAIECRHAVYIPTSKVSNDDYHYIKEAIHLKDGSVVPNVRVLKNWKRPFWVTKKGRQVHKQKKELESLDNVYRYECAQKDLVQKAAKALETPWFKGSLRDLNNSPYLYGTDKFSTALMKDEYRKKWPDTFTGSTVACFDTETYLGDGSIIMATISFKDKVYTAVQKKFFEGYANTESRLQEAFDRYLTKYKEERKINWVVELVDSEIDVIRNCFNKAHEWQPDFLAIWNINFDLPKMLEACDRAGVDPKDIFADPKLPNHLKFFKYKEGKKNKVMASGKVIPINLADQWHVVFCPSSFYFIDAMCVYRKLRTQRGELPRYSLDFVLDRELGERKLNFSQAEHVSGFDWHHLMQTQFPIEYVIYNVFDCVGMELLDEKIKDLSIDIPSSCRYSDYRSFESLPKRTIDELHCFFLDELNSVIGSTADSLKLDMDKHLPSNNDLIVNLKAYLITDDGLQCIEEYPTLKTRFRLYCYDLDVSAAYPSNTDVLNVSKGTCRMILCRIENKTEAEMRAATINFSGGHTNSVELAESMFGLPTLSQLLQHYEKSKVA